jgi:predicted TPR repeat methyltransferase
MELTALEIPAAKHVTDQIQRWRGQSVEFDALLTQHGDALPALQQFAAICRGDHRQDTAIEALLAAVSIDPADASLWRELALVYQLGGRDEPAAACAQKSVALDPDHAPTWLQYASLAYRLQHIPESEAAYHRALRIDPGLSAANLGLGVLYLNARKGEDATKHLLMSLTSQVTDAVAYLCLGQSHYMTGRFADSAAAFERAANVLPMEGATLGLYARAKTFAAILDGDIAGALARYPAIAGPGAEQIDDLLLNAFSLFSAYGMQEAAVTVGQMRLDMRPDDAVQRYLLDAVSGQQYDRAPATYIEQHFDEFAEKFDRKLVDVLGYSVPQDLAKLVAESRSTFSAVLDLGCGTGLAAQPLQKLCANLTGVDLSDKMLAEAARRGAYRVLIKDDVVTFLETHRQAFDLVFAADLLVYFGKLDRLVTTIAGALTPDGLFAASIEHAGDGDTILLPSGRFAHSETYFETTVAPYFDIVQKQVSTLRSEAGLPVPGLLYVLRLGRRPSAT